MTTPLGFFGGGGGVVTGWVAGGIGLKGGVGRRDVAAAAGSAAAADAASSPVASGPSSHLRPCSAAALAKYPAALPPPSTATSHSRGAIAVGGTRRLRGCAGAGGGGAVAGAGRGGAPTAGRGGWGDPAAGECGRPPLRRGGPERPLCARPCCGPHPAARGAAASARAPRGAPAAAARQPAPAHLKRTRAAASNRSRREWGRRRGRAGFLVAGTPSRPASRPDATLNPAP
jgi:hypothetical protein